MTFKTKDFYIAVTLKSVGYRLAAIEPTEDKGKKIVMFVFEDENNSINQTINDYYDDVLQVNARTFMDNMRELKTRMYDYL